MYVAGLVIPVPEEKMEAYRKWAENGAKLFKDYGCLEIVECWEDFVPDGKQTDFRRAVAAKDGREDRLHLANLARQGELLRRRREDAPGRAHGHGRRAAIRCEAPHPRLLRADLFDGEGLRSLTSATPRTRLRPCSGTPRGPLRPHALRGYLGAGTGLNL